MAIAITEIILFLIFFAVGEESGHVGASLLIWFFISVMIVPLLGSAEWAVNTEEGREHAKKRRECEDKEWNEWRYRYEDDLRCKKKK